LWDHDQNKLIADEQRNQQIHGLAGNQDKPNAFGHKKGWFGLRAGQKT
jgi:hypothetical protein